MSLNERAWAGHVISWIKEAIEKGQTIFEEATNDESLKVHTGRTKYPDVLLFSNKVSGIVFNGWELKFPDTFVDDRKMLENALEKAKKLGSNSIVTWNGSNTIIWKITNDNYNFASLIPLKEYGSLKDINTRDDLAKRSNYLKHEKKLRERLLSILHDLEQFYENGELKQAIDISESFISAIKHAADIIVPQFQVEINNLKGSNRDFRDRFNEWKIVERSTLKILATSSRRPENVIEEEVLAKLIYYQLIGKILFYLTLSENLSKYIPKLHIDNKNYLQEKLGDFFKAAMEIDYQAIFKPDFTNILKYNQVINDKLNSLINLFNEYDFKELRALILGTVLENLVPQNEKQKFGQYFTQETLANLVSFPAIQTFNDLLFDPTCGTGTFLNSFYRILQYFGKVNHVDLLNQIWGNDISLFPAVLSVINLYKQDVTETDNFPRVIRDDFFNLNPGKFIQLPNSKDFKEMINVKIPYFDAIISNFPFVQQEDIPNESLSLHFRKKFQDKQRAFLKDNDFKINERADYFTYCFYNSFRFLKKDGFISVITSNAWLGKEYGIQFKKFILDNFSIKYIIRSSAEHWFRDSKVSTLFTTVQKGTSSNATKFITINFKLTQYFDQTNVIAQLKQIEELYSDIDHCDDQRNNNWKQDQMFDNVFHRRDGSITTSIVSKDSLLNSLSSKENWSAFFISNNLFEYIESKLIRAYPKIIDSFRGERTGWNKMYIIPKSRLKEIDIEKIFLKPYVKGPGEIKNYEFSNEYKYFLFVCNKPESELKLRFPGAYSWIEKFRNSLNKNKTKTIIQKGIEDRHKPFWYSLNPKAANIVTQINPFERHFFCFSKKRFIPDQRFGIINVKDGYDVELVSALLNSTISYLLIELRGTDRNLGALDLNANYFKSFKILNPDLLNVASKKSILRKFQPLKNRAILKIEEELKMQDRIEFDKEILKSFNLNILLLDNIYITLLDEIRNRVEMSTR